MNGYEKNENEYVKIGARMLDENEMKVLLPNYSQIENQLQHIRQGAHQYRTAMEGVSRKDPFSSAYHSEFHKDYNNVFSILGGRGSGKTSVLLTLKSKQMNSGSNQVSNIVLPLIVPEEMGAKGNVLGWIISAFSEHVDNMLKKVRKQKEEGCSQGSSCWDRSEKECCTRGIGNTHPLQQKYDKLKEMYAKCQPEYREIIRQEFVDMAEYIDESSGALMAERKILKCFREFIDVLLKTYHQTHVCKDETDEPLLFIFFDDVDLCLSRCTEILEIILRYLSHPGIVVFLAGNYDNFFVSTPVCF